MVLPCFRCADNSSAGARYQDEKYGKGRRVHNRIHKAMSRGVNYRCTVCKTERGSSK